MYKLIAMDLDGTLNNDAKQIAPRTREALLRLQEKGIKLALASARPTHGLFRERDALNLCEHGGILMAYNGGRITQASDGKVLFETSMPIDLTRQVLTALKRFPVTLIVDDGELFYVKDRKAFMVEYECANNCMTCTEVPDIENSLNFAPVKILMSVQPERLKETQAAIAAILPESLTIVQTAPFYLEVIPSSINKGQGIKAICRVLSLSESEVMAFGDAANDIPMLQTAGFGVAMGNADEAVKAAADWVTLSNNEDGIAYAIEKKKEEFL